jgi:16S rRNA (cytosine967-C5)-methyltransferase
LLSTPEKSVTSIAILIYTLVIVVGHVRGLYKEAWAIAIETLSWMQMRRINESLAFARTVKQLNVDNPDALRLARLLVYETSRRQNFLNIFINEALEPRSLDENDLGVQAFLRLYVYQTRISRNWSRTDLKEAEKIAGLGRSILGWQALQRVEDILGLLITQEQKSAPEGVDDERRIALSTFHPKWFVKYCLRTFGRSKGIQILESNNRPPSVYIRINTIKEQESNIMDKLKQEGIEVEKEQKLKYVYKLKSAKQPPATAGSFRNGLFYLQDKASCFAAEAANPKPGTTVLDVCAAPGAKTTYLAQLMHNQGEIYSLDYSQRRIAAWRNEVKRMNVTIAEPIIADVRKQMPITNGADVVVLDPPCTSTGTFRKLPSSRWRLTPRSIQTMATIQWQMITSCAKQVRNGGFLIYSTCSIVVEENEMIIERFLKHNPEFSLTELSPKIGLPGMRGLEKCQRLYPHIHDCNGFFIAKLSKET